MRGRPAFKDIEKHLFVSDFQIPEQDDLAINAVLKFIPDFKPDVIHFVGDILDLTKQSRFDHSPYDKHTLQDELVIAKRVLGEFSKAAKKANPDVVLNFYEGNHEMRQLFSLAKTGFAEIEEDGEYILSLKSLLKLKELGINWIGYHSEHIEKGNVLVTHGDLARSHSAYTAKAMLDKRGISGISGHTHRIGMHMRTQSGITKWWMEIGALCKLNFKHPYRSANDWQMGFGIGIYMKQTGRMHPTLIPMFDKTFYYEGKTYQGSL
jgi:hypothetical protein